MAEYTTNYNLYKPNRVDTDPVDTTLSANFQTIDDEIKKREMDIANLTSNLDSKTSNIQTQIDTDRSMLQEQIDSKTVILQDQVDALVISGDSSPAIAQALAGTPYDTLQAHIADFLQIGVTSFTYDTEGNITNITTPTSSITLHYVDGEIEKVSETIGAKTIETTYTFDIDGIVSGVNRVVI